MQSAIRKAVALANGSQTELARRIGAPVRQGHVWEWLRRGYPPAEQVLPIVRALHGAITPHELRPDIYPDPEWMPGDLSTEPPEAIRDA